MALNSTAKGFINNSNKLPTFAHCLLLLLSTGYAAINRYLLPAELTAANLQQPE